MLGSLNHIIRRQMIESSGIEFKEQKPAILIWIMHKACIIALFFVVAMIFATN